MLLADLVATADLVAATSGRSAKRDALAALLRRLEPAEIEPAVGFLIADPRQGRVGVGWSTVATASRARATAAETGEAPRDGVTVAELDDLFDRLQAASGPGSNTERAARLQALFARTTDAEADFVRRLIAGELRQGASAGVMTDAIAAAAEVPVASVRRAAMLSGDLRRTAAIALTEGRAGLDRVGLTVLEPVQPMLAGTAESVDAAMAGDDAGPVSVEWKLDGARIQVHRAGDEVRVFTRNLNEIGARLPEVVRIARSLPAERFVLDAEVLELRPDQRPAAFQDTMRRVGRQRDLAGPGPGDGDGPAEPALLPFVFDLVHLDGQDLLDEPLGERLEALEPLAGPFRIPGLVTTDAVEAQRFLDEAIAAGHEGVMVKELASPYQAGRRGTAWRKVKPVRLFDLVVLAAEWGHGRRTGWLSNLHLGARDPTTGGFVMVGKTFKGLTDALLTTQTEALLAREVGRDGITVHVRPELVVEIAIDGVQASTRYPGGVALRFARVRRYRDDKPAAEADTLESLQALLVR